MNIEEAIGGLGVLDPVPVPVRVLSRVGRGRGRLVVRESRGAGPGGGTSIYLLLSTGFSRYTL